jgi:5-methylcytosine-specific restriction endonuclease McrA
MDPFEEILNWSRRQQGGRAVPGETRRAVLARARGRCEDCGRALPLELHHNHYRSVGEEEPDDLSALCRDCHKQRHIDPCGGWWNDPEEKESYWQPYFEEMDRD